MNACGLFPSRLYISAWPRVSYPSVSRRVPRATVRPRLRKRQLAKRPQLKAKAKRVVAAVNVKESVAATECPRGPHWAVHKFGGTCMATAERIQQAVDLILDQESRSTVVVVSAMGSHSSSPMKVTDIILNMLSKAGESNHSFREDLSMLKEKHVHAARELLEEGELMTDFLNTLDEDISNLEAMLRAIAVAGTITEAFSDFVVGHGELWSARLFASRCQQKGVKAQFMDARDILVVSPSSDNTWVDVHYDISNKNLDKWSTTNGIPEVIVVTGFIARNQHGRAATLRRNGSDFSATIFGALFDAGHITIWTDVDGVFSADPRKVTEAFCIDEMTYNEAWELSYFGANVLHPRTTLPALKHGIPITLRNFFNIDAPGTKIKSVSHSFTMVKGFATIDDVTLVNVEGTGMAGVPGIAAKVFSVIRDKGINVIIITQGSSEQSICFAVKEDDGDLAVSVLRSAFADDIQSGIISTIRRSKNCCILAAVGEEMANKKGMTAMFMSALATANVNIKAIAQGSSEYNITVLINQDDAFRALQAVHTRFYASKVTVGVGLVGPGLIGKTFLDQLNSQMKKLKEESNIDVRVLGIASLSHLLLNDNGIDLESDWKTQLKQTAGSDLDQLTDHICNSFIPNRVIVDCTASDALPERYLEWLTKGIHVITPNKKLGSGPLEQYLSVRKTQRESYTHWFYEATVGAGLPVIATLKHLVSTGDQVKRIDGIFSGTLSYIFNNLKPGQSFSQVVAEAKEKGYTEPDPRDDLQGMDVARKVTILARECGLMLELEDVTVESLVPEPLRHCENTDEFMEKLPEYDEQLTERILTAESKGEVLRYVGVVDCDTKKGSVELTSYPMTHPFAQLSGSDNIISFVTERYFQQPLIIRGPGAGAAVTAGGVFSDFLRLTDHFGAPT